MGFVTKKVAASKRNGSKSGKKKSKLSSDRHLLHPKLKQEPEHSTTDDPLLTVMAIKEEPLEEVFAKPLDPIPAEPSSFCSLCLRQCTADQVQEFASFQQWNGASVSDRQEKLEQVLGGLLQVEAICRTCWAMVEMVVDFRQSCLRMVELRERFPGGLEKKDEGEEWFSEETTQGFVRTRTMIQDHVDRVEMAEVDVRNDLEVRLKEEAGNDPVPNFEDDHFEDDFGSTSNEVMEGTEDTSVVESMPTETNLMQLFTCTNCERTFDNKVSLRVHTNYCNGSKNDNFYKCTICAADFMCRASLVGHLNKHKGIKPYECSKPNCTMTFYSPLSRRAHEMGCGASRFVCSVCGTVCKTPSSYLTHKATHEEPKLPCLECHKTFTTTNYLKRHMKVHTNAREYPCSVCDKAFKTNYAARVHMRIHTQEKPFSCQICGQGFAYKCLVKPHMEKNHVGAICD